MTSAPGTARAFSMSPSEVPLEGGPDPIHGNVTWHTLISGDRTPSRDMVLGIAHLDPGGWLGLHRHDPPEFYLGLSGEATASVDGQVFRIAPGVALFIPGNAEHGIIAGPEGCEFAYGFAVGSFSDVVYRYSGEAGGAARATGDGPIRKGLLARLAARLRRRGGR